MDGGRRRNLPKIASEDMAVAVAGEGSVIVVDDDSSLDLEISHLRGRWELASVLNFLTVFEPVIGSDLKLTAEEIEAGLVKPNGSLVQLHIKLLKGIPPVSKTLNGTNAWVTVLCKKLAAWWPWVAEGELPLVTSKGEEISRYKELDPITRLLILKALCEIRADQDDAVSYLNDALKNGTEISSFRKEKIGGDGKSTSYWCDGNTTIGHRLYKEVNNDDMKTKMKGKASKSLPAICFQWETLATNLDEFRNVVDKLSSSRKVAETAIGKAIETDMLPVIEKIQKKKEMAQKRKERQEKLLNDTRSYSTGITRSCRNRRLISYTFDEYDRAIDEAIEVTRKRSKKEDQKNERNHFKQRNFLSDGDSETGRDLMENDQINGDTNMGIDSEDGNENKRKEVDSETESDKIHEPSKKEGGGDDDNDDDYNIQSDDGNDDDVDTDEVGNTDEEGENPEDRKHASKPIGTRWSQRLADSSLASRNLGSKNRLRQRPTRNSALDHIVPDSEDESTSEHTNNKAEHKDSSPIANSDEEVSDF